MEFNYSYLGQSSIANSVNGTSMSFAPDTLRQPTFFRGQLRQSLQEAESGSLGVYHYHCQALAVTIFLPRRNPVRAGATAVPIAFTRVRRVCHRQAEDCRL